MHDVIARGPVVWQRYWNTVLRLRDKQLLALVLLVLAGSAVYYVSTKLNKMLAGSYAPAILSINVIMLGAAAAVATWHREARYAEIWRPLHILMRGAGAVIFAQICFDAFDPGAMTSNVIMGTDPLARLIVGFALLCGGLAISRPAFLLPMGLAYIQFRFGVPKLFGMGATSLDFLTLNDVATFGAMSLIGWRTVERHVGLVPWPVLREVVECPSSYGIFQRLIWGVCVGAHLGNYFHSGLAKLMVGLPNPFFWIVENPTAQSIAIGLHRFNAPLAAWPELLQSYHDLLSNFVIPFNIAVFFIQLLAPLAIVKRRLLIVVTLFFDAMHIGIYFSLGAFFFFWVALNVVILLSLKAMKDADLTPALKITVVLTAVFGHFTFSTAQLGWMDGKKLVRELFYANTEDGRRVLVPPATFGLFSYQIAHGDLYVPEGHFRMRMGGNATRADWSDVSTCGPQTVTNQVYVKSVDSIRDMVIATDTYFRHHPWVRDFQLYYVYPHHTPSNPVFFADYAATPLEKIRSYTYVVESACIGVSDGKLDNQVKVRSEYTFDVDR